MSILLDIDECSQSSPPCSGAAYASCINSVASWECTCATGYTHSSVNNLKQTCEGKNFCENVTQYINTVVSF